MGLNVFARGSGRSIKPTMSRTISAASSPVGPDNTAPKPHALRACNHPAIWANCLSTQKQHTYAKTSLHLCCLGEQSQKKHTQTDALLVFTQIQTQIKSDQVDQYASTQYAWDASMHEWGTDGVCACNTNS